MTQISQLGDIARAEAIGRDSGWSTLGGGAAIAVFGPKDYVRSTGKPETVTDTFAVANPGAAQLHITNGGASGQYARVSSAVISLNGQTILSPNDFNQQAAMIDLVVPLQAVNTLTVELRSQPNSGLTLAIIMDDTGGNQAPVANAGPDRNTAVGQPVTLDGTGSSDADGDPLTFQWTKVTAPAGSVANLSNPNATSPTFVPDVPGAYEFSLRVNDGTTDSAPDFVRVTVANAVPIANAGPDQTAPVGATVTLDGSASSDSDGSPLTFAWTFLSRPAGSSAVLTNANTPAPTFVIDRAGAYVVQLIVNDGLADSAPDTVTISTLNSKPTAHAGPDQTAAVGATVTLDGSASQDVDGNPLTYHWSFTALPPGSAATLSNPQAVSPTFVVDRPGSYGVQLIVNDGALDSDPDSVVVSTVNSPPVANAGSDRTALVGQTITLDGSASSDVDGDALTFRWSLTSVPPGSAATLSDMNAVMPSFVVDRPGTYVARLIVNDGSADSAPDSVTVSTVNSKPTANAGPDQTAPVGTLIMLNGGGSTDVDGDPLTFRWSFTSRPAGSAATLSDPLAVNPTFTIDRPGAYAVQLIVNDGTVDSDPDTVTISTVNSPPVANAGNDQSVFVGQTVTLNGGGSSDVDGDALTYHWALTSMPAGSAATLSDASAVAPMFVVDRPGTYIAQLVVNDGVADSAPDTVTISTLNSAPVANAGADQSAPVGAAVVLDGSGSTDADFDALTFQWAFTTRPVGSAAVLSDPLAMSPSFTIDRAGTYVVQLIVNDGTVDSAADSVTVSTTNSRPVANAGADQTALLGAVVTLDGTGSSDVDFDPLTYRWAIIARPAGSTATLSDPFAPQPSFAPDAGGTFVVQLIVNDGFVDSDPDTATVTVQIQVPDVVGMPQAQAESVLGGVGLGTTINTEYHDTVPAGAVIQQSPLAGEIVAAGTSVALLISLGPSAVVPDVVGMTEADAGAAIAANNLVVGNVTSENSNTVPAGQVIRQTPAGGTIVARGSAVDLVISLGAAVPVLTSIDVTPANASIPRGQSLQFVATGNFSDGHQENLTASVSWESTNLAVAGINLAGLASALDTGATTIRAISGAIVGTTGLSVTGPSLASIVVTPADPILLTTETLQFNATGVLSDGTSQNLNGQVTWSSTDPSKAGINPTTGLATGLVEGPTTIGAAKDGVTGSTVLTVQTKVADPTPPAVAITAPANNATVTNAVNIVGSATDANFSKYQLEYAPAGSTAFTLISTGLSPVANGVLGVFDPTLVLNDLYTVRVRVFDRGGNITTASRVFQVSRDVKVGNFTLTFTDLNVPMVGLPITVNRVYDSRDKRPGDFGIGWRLDIQTLRLRANRVLGEAWQGTVSGGFLPNYCIQPTDDHKVSITLADGTVEEFNMVTVPQCQQLFPIQFADIAFQPRAGTRGRLVPLDQISVMVSGGYPGPLELLDDGTLDLVNPQRFRYTTYEGTEFVISKTAGVESVKDRNGNTLTFTPNGITHNAGASVTFLRDAQGRITRMTAPDGKISNYTIDANGDLASFIDPAGNTTRYYYNLNHGVVEIVDPRGLRPLKNEYDASGRLVAHIDAQGRRVEYTHTIGTRQEVVLDRNGGQTVYEYDAAGNVVKITDPLGKIRTFTFDARGNKLSETDPLGKTTSYTYDASNNPTSQTDAIGRKTSQTFNANGQVLTQTDGLGRVTQSSYNATGNLLTSRDAAGNTSNFTYDAKGNQLTARDPLGNTITSEYDPNGRQTKRTDPLGHFFTATYDASGRRLTETNPLGGITKFTYDAAGRDIAVESPLGHISRTEYDATGNPTATIDATGNRTEHTYDQANRLLSTKFPDGTTTQNSYDAEGNLTSFVDQLGRKTEHTYNGLKQRTETRHPDGTTVKFTYDVAGRLLTTIDEVGNVTQSQYDAVGRETKEIDPLGHETLQAFDNADNLIGRTDPNNNSTQFAYDQLNRLTTVTLPGGQTSSEAFDIGGRRTSATDAAGRTTQFGYDANGKVTSVTDAAGGITRFEYDAAGNRTAVVDARNNRTQFTYDVASRLTSTTYPNGGVETYTYDGAGRVIAKQDPNGQVTNFTYDRLGRLLTRAQGGSSVSFTYTATGRRASASDARGVTQYAYDARDRLTTLTSPDGQTINYTYDAANNLTSIASLAGTISYIYDKGRLKEVTDPAGRVTSFTYDAAGNRTGLTYPNGTSAAYVYDVNNRLTQMTHNGPSAQLANYAFTLNAIGSRTRIDESTGAIKNYSYDVLHRLIEERVTDLAANPLFENDFTYDAVGNRLTKNSSSAGGGPVTTNYAYNAADQLVTEDGVAYTYDLNGNLITKTDAGGVTAYTYDFDNRLIRIVEPSGATTNYRYDADGNRVEKQDATGTLRYLVDTNRQFAQVLAEYTPAGALIAAYVYADDLISMTRGGQVAFYHFDGTGSTRLLTDLAGVVTDTYQFDAFGTLVARTGTTANPFLFTGQQFDANSGFYYMRARFYQPSTGRFLTLDTHLGASSDPRSLHRYVYAVNDPVNLTDPSGQFSLGSLSISMSIGNIVRGIASLAVNVIIDYVMAQITGAEFNIFTSVVENLAFGAVGKGLKLGVNMVQRSPNTINALLQAARRGIREHTRWSQIVEQAMKQAGRTPGHCAGCYSINKGIRDLAGKVKRIGDDNKYARPDFVDYSKDLIVDLKPVPKAIYDAGEQATQDYLLSIHRKQVEFYQEVYFAARGVVPDFKFAVYIK